jgi:HSP20 family protein
MARQDFNPWDILLQWEADLRRNSEGAMRAVLFQPSVDVYEIDSDLVIKVELSGVPPESLNITLSADNRELTVSGRRREPQEERDRRLRCYQLEIFYGDFTRVIALPADIAIDRDRIKANYRDGFLVIALPKRDEARAEKRVIPITQE